MNVKKLEVMEKKIRTLSNEVFYLKEKVKKLQDIQIMREESAIIMLEHIKEVEI